MTGMIKRPDYLDGLNRYQLLIPLESSLTNPPEMVATLNLRRLTLHDQAILEKPVGYAQRLAEVISEMVGLPRVIIEKLDAVDADRIDAIFGYFLHDEEAEPVKTPRLEDADQAPALPERPSYLDGGNGFRLLYPLPGANGESDVDTLQLRRINIADRMILDEPMPYAERLGKVVAGMTGLPRHRIMKMDAVDAARVDRIFGYFMKPGTAIGAIS